MQIKLTQFALVALLSSFFFTSCSIERRVYNSGFHIDWFSAKQNQSKQSPQTRNAPSPVEMAQHNQESTETDFVTNHSLLESSASSSIIYNEPSPKVVSVFKKDEKVKSNVFQKFALLRAQNSMSSLVLYSPVLPNNQPQDSNTPAGKSGFAIAGFVLGILGLILTLITGFPFLMGSLAVIFSAVGLGETQKGKEGKGMATAGLILGILSIVLFWTIVILIGMMI